MTSFSDHSPVPIRPFFWSLRRQRRFDFCRRGYFLYYYSCTGGHDENALPVIRARHHRKRLRPPDSWVAELAADVLRDHFYNNLPLASGPLEGALLRRCRRFLHAWISGAAEADHSLPLPQLPEGPLWPAIRRLEQQLRDAIRSPGMTALLEELSRIPFPARVPLPLPLTIHLNRLTVYGAPTLLFLCDGKPEFLELCRELPSPEDADVRTLIHRYHAWECLKIPPDRVCSRYIRFRDGAADGGETVGNPAAAIDRILNGAAAMAEYLLPDGSVREEDFPPRQEDCGRCIFAEDCKKQWKK